jgi:hypothetical protein
MDTFNKVLKRVLSILLIATFFTAQYARQFAYLQCRLVTVGMQDCGCGKATDIDKLGEDGHPLSKNHVHLSLDDFFAQPTQPSQAPVLYFPASTKKAVYAPCTCQGCSTAVDHPPQMA